MKNIKSLMAVTLIELMIAVSIICLLLGIFVPVAVKCFGYSEGQRIGVVTKMSYKGIFFKSYEGEMNMGGIVANTQAGVTPNVWKFSVTSKSVANTIESQMGKQVILKYVEKPVFIIRETSYDIIDVNTNISSKL